MLSAGPTVDEDSDVDAAVKSDLDVNTEANVDTDAVGRQKAIEGAKNALIRTQLKKGTTQLVLAGLRAAVNQRGEVESIRKFLYRLPAYEKLDESQRQIYLDSFHVAINSNDIYEFLNPNELILPAEHILDGLSISLKTGNSSITERFGSVLESVASHQLETKGLSQELFEVLNALIVNGYKELVIRLLNTHFEVVKEYSARLFFKAIQMQQLGIIKEGFLPNRLSPENILDGLAYAIKLGHKSIIDILGSELEVVTKEQLWNPVLQNKLVEVLKELMIKGHTEWVIKLLNKHVEVVKDHLASLFLLAIKTQQLSVIDAFLGSSRLSAENILDGLAAAVTLGHKPIINKLGLALESIPSDQLDTPPLRNKLFEVLKDLIINGHSDLALRLLEKHFAVLKHHISELATFCYKRLPENTTIVSASFGTPLAVLKYIVHKAVTSLTHEQLPAVMIRLQKFNAIVQVITLLEIEGIQYPIEFLNNRLLYALEQNQVDLVPLMVCVCLNHHQDAWPRAWFPSFAMFRAVIDGNVELLPNLLTANPTNAILRGALLYAASKGQQQATHSLLSRLKAINYKITNIKVLKAAVEKQQEGIVVYLFANLPRLSIDQMCSSLRYASEGFKPRMEALIKFEIERDKARKMAQDEAELVQSMVPLDGLTDVNVHKRFIDVITRLDEMSHQAKSSFNMQGLVESIDDFLSEVLPSNPTATTTQSPRVPPLITSDSLRRSRYDMVEDALPPQVAEKDVGVRINPK